jgi:hypothetical protein
MAQCLIKHKNFILTLCHRYTRIVEFKSQGYKVKVGSNRMLEEAHKYFNVALTEEFHTW